jgi:hypothetical protein
MKYEKEKNNLKYMKIKEFEKSGVKRNDVG